VNFLWYLLIVSCAFQVVYQLILITSIIIHKKKLNRETQTSSENKSVSVIICAKNETENLQKNLPFILNQKFKDFEVIVVDDGSDEPFTMNDKRLTIITLTKSEKIGLGKKYALQKGIEMASNEVILLTDADCQPVSENWISEMTSLINEKHKIVLGISPYKKENTFLNALIEYETAQTALQYLGFALMGKPYMSVGRNVCYDANLLKSKRWNEEELAIASGDDDLTLQSLATNNNTTVCFSKDSYTLSEAKNTWKSWFDQKTRHAESGFLYPFPFKMALGSFIFTKNVNYLCFFYLFCMLNKINFVALLLVIVTMMITCIVNMLLHITLNLQKRWNFTLILDPIYGTIPLFTGLQNLFQSNRKWK
jgi:glycosyltransferase involved in cell wall biosynthesis